MPGHALQYGRRDLTPKERALGAKAAINTRWANEKDRTAATAPGRKAFMERFEKQVDPEGLLDPAERSKRALNAKRAYFQRLALARSKARRQAKLTPAQQAVVAEQEQAS